VPFRDTLHYRILCTFPLFRADCLGGTYVCTGTAVSTQLGIDHIDISFTDGLYGAFIDTGPTGSAIIGNYVSHIFKFIDSNATNVMEISCLAINRG
jgi:hypothetical protein